MNMIPRLLLGLSILLVSATSSADTAAGTQLNALSHVAKELNYEGIFSYQTSKRLQSIRIIHRANEQGEVERLVSLNGVAREVIRTNEMVTCIYPEGKRVQENNQPLGQGFPTDFLARLAAASAYYNVSEGRQERVAAHHTQALMVQPVDNYRYGYQLWVDKKNNLLLQSDLVDMEGNILETFAFTSIDMGQDIADELLQAQLQGNEMSWNRDEKETQLSQKIERVASPWHVAWLPTGFNLVMHQSRFKARNGASVEQQVYSDGLSSISIFIEKIRARHSHLKGGSHMGVANAFGTIMKAHFVTVVGQVPAHTVEKIGSSIRYDESE